MASTGLYRYRVNGVIDTNNTVMANLEALGNSAGSWLTYDTQDGKWAVVINRARTVDAYFDDDNIVGSITVNGTGLDNFYNSVEVQFPHRDLNDQADWINDSNVHYLDMGNITRRKVDRRIKAVGQHQHQVRGLVGGVAVEQ